MNGADKLGFGNFFTPHMVQATWTTADGWSPLELTAHQALSLSPAAMALHYGQAIFEGLKAYPRPDGSVALFRPRANAVRFRASAARLAMPEMPEEVFLAACESLLRVDLAHVPRGDGQSLYLRPFMIATEASLGVRPAREFLFAVIASPVDHFFDKGFTAVDVWCGVDDIRAASGGTGAAKCAGNYAGSLRAKAQAVANGCSEVLWLDAAERRWIEELGAMNFFCVVRHPDGALELATPPLSDTILAGNTRDSVLTLAAAHGLRTSARPIAIEELTRADSPVVEAFASGTAAAISPIGAVRTRRGRFVVGDGQPGPVTTTLAQELSAIQYGRRPDAHGWMACVEPATQPADPVLSAG
ncbi:branched-chain amino acid aminotransferase [Micromonospora sp. NPDC000089]|uniref:branched-chain amino acid aminotransferase n=1 Tax=unclassified Micromonospora TaxID=2617518 RepID=UPI0036AA1B5A